MRYPAEPDTVTMGVTDFAAKSDKYRQVFVGYRAGCIQFPKVDLAIDPYFMGLWLGDGDKDTARVTTADPEIINFLTKYAASLGLRIVVSGWPHRTTAVRVGLRSKPSTPNPILTGLKKYGVLNNKSVPSDFMYTSEQDRLDLLAGLLDSDGSWKGNRYVFTTTLGGLASQVKQLADQLGFRVGVQQHTYTKATSGKAGVAWRVTIGGDTWRIPCQVQRKKSEPRRLGRSRLTSVLTVRPVGRGPFAGFSVGGDHLFLLADGTVTHNSQLPPVNDEFCFLTAAWKSTRFLPILLRTQVRSQDAVYSRILRKVRYSEIDDEVINFLEERYNPHADDTWVRGLPRKRDVEAWNTRKLYDLGNEITTLRPITWGPDWAVKSLLSSLPVPAELSIAQDAYVMFRINHPEGLFANGTTGYIREIRREVLIVDLANASGKRSDNTIEVPRASFNLPDTGNRGDIAGVRQFPIQLAWAVTIHKLQGATLTHAAVDLGDLWEPGQAYVALSRVRKAEDVSVLGWSHKSFSSHPSVIKFYEIIEKLG